MPSQRTDVEKWTEVLESQDKFVRFREFREPKLKKWVRRGIPEVCKGRAWQFLSGSVTAVIPGKYVELVKAKLPATVVADIQVDLPRTFPKNPHFRKPAERERIRRVLHAYAAHDPAVGYVQGMAFVSGALLFYMGEEEAFWLLATLMHKYNYHNALIQDFPFVRLCLAQLQHVIKKFTPALHQRLHQNGAVSCVPVELFSSAFVALFADSLPWPLFTRVWDSFFFEEWKTIFRFVAALLQHHEPRLAALGDDGDLITAMQIGALVDGLDFDQLMDRAFRVRLRSSTLYRACKRYSKQRLEEWLGELDLQGLALAMQGSEDPVPLATHTSYLRRYTHCFTVRQGVEWLVRCMAAGRLPLYCGACRPRSPHPSLSPPVRPAAFPNFAGLAMTVDLTPPSQASLDLVNLSLPSAALSPDTLATSYRAPVLACSSGDLNPDSRGASQRPSAAELAPSSTAPTETDLHSPTFGVLEPKEDDEGGEEEPWEQEQEVFCWCQAKLGTDTAYYTKYVQDHGARLERYQRGKARAILTAMEARGLLHAVRGAEDRAWEDGSLLRFGPRP